MGAVYRASDEHLHIPVAVKENLFLTEEYGRQFQREAHILAGLRHSNLPHVTDYFSMENQVQYLVMDYIEGEDLRQRMERMGSLPERETMLIGISICDALSYLHTRRPPIVHRDIKPGNIKVTPDGQAVLVDFGLAKIMQGSQATSTGARAMTPGYSPPEQYGTARTDSRSDIYSLGATLYAALTGVIPEDGLARMTGRSKLTPIRELVPKVNRRLADSIERALEIESEDRFQDAEEFKQALIESGELTPYYPEPPVITPPPPVPGNGSEVNDLLKEEVDVGPSASGPRSQSPYWLRNSYRRRLKKRLRWAIPAALVLAVAIYGLFINRSLLPNSVLSYFNPTATAQVQSTEVLSAQNGPTSDLAGPPTSTPGPSLTEQALQTAVAQLSTPALELTTTVTPTLGPSPSPSPTPLGGGYSQIAFASDMAGDWEIWLIDANAKKPAPRQITDMPNGSCQASWSPDGMRLAFISPCPGKQDLYRGSQIYTINADGSDLVQLTDSLEGDFDPAWSPLGDKIAFTSLRSGTPAIYVINLATNEITELSNSLHGDRQPSWSPDGSKIAFIRQIGSGQVWIMSSDGSKQDEFTISGSRNNLWPTWSPDGKIIFFSQTSPDSTVPLLKYMRLEDQQTEKENRLPANPQGRDGPYAEVSPSPDGNWLAYESWPETNHDIYIMNKNGTDPQRLTSNKGFDFGPVWRPMATDTISTP